MDTQEWEDDWPHTGTNKLSRLRGVTDVQPKDQPLISKAAARAQNVNTPPEAGAPNILSYFGTNNNS